MRVGISAGHSSVEPGASGYAGYKEHILARDLLTRLLRANGADIELIDCTGEGTGCLSKAIKATNKSGANLALQIHLNAGGGTGVEAYVNIQNKTAEAYAKNICSNISKLGFKNRGVKSHITDRFKNGMGFINQTSMSAILLEVCFIDNKNDVELFLKEIGSIALAILNALGAKNATGDTKLPNPSQNAPQPPQGATGSKTNEQIADEVERGKWGNGQDRKNRLVAEGYDYNAIQAIINARYGVKATPKPSTPQPSQPARMTNQQVAAEVWAGKWGNGQDRKNRLVAEGYDYNAIQKLVNAMAKK